MKSSSILLVGTMLITSCRTHGTPDSHFQITHEALTTMDMLRYLDQGNVDYVKYTEMRRVFAQLETLAKMDRQSEPDEMEKGDEILLAREALDYLSAHRDEFDSVGALMQARVHVLQEILTNPDDTGRLKELNDHYAHYPKFNEHLRAP